MSERREFSVGDPQQLNRQMHQYLVEGNVGTARVIYDQALNAYGDNGGMKYFDNTLAIFGLTRETIQEPVRIKGTWPKD